MVSGELSKKDRRLLIFTVGYMALFTSIAILRGNREFLYYIMLMVGLVLFVVAYHGKLHLGDLVLAGLSIVGLLHVMGGNIYIGETRLYETYLIGEVLRYDNLVHSFGTFVITLVLYSALIPHVDQAVRGSIAVLSIILVLMAMGAGALNEIVEFGAVALLDAHQQVGDYWNNSLDLLFNLAGSMAAVTLVNLTRRRERRRVARLSTGATVSGGPDDLGASV
jgi:putative membrane protein